MHQDKIFDYATRLDCIDAMHTAAQLAVNRLPNEAIMKALLAGFMLDNAEEPIETVLAGFLCDAVVCERIPISQVWKQFGVIVAERIQVCSEDSALQDAAAKSADLFRTVQDYGRDAIVLQTARMAVQSRIFSSSTQHKQPAESDFDTLKAFERWYALAKEEIPNHPATRSLAGNIRLIQQDLQSIKP